MNRTTSGWIFGFFGMLLFSGSLPATRMAMPDFDPFFLTFARAAIAGAIACLLLAATRTKRPCMQDLGALVLIAVCVVFGFPLLTALAMVTAPASHALVFIGLLPLCTALFGIVLGAAVPRKSFWIFSGLGAALIMSFSLLTNKEPDAPSFGTADLFMAAAVMVCGLGYALGAKISARLGGWRTTCWALALSWPVMTGCVLLMSPAQFAKMPVSAIPLTAWAGLAYVALFSSLVGFFLWYRGLADGGVVAVGQLQLLQPFCGLVFSSLLLGETIGWPLIATAFGVAVCVYGARRFSLNKSPPQAVAQKTDLATQTWDKTVYERPV